MNPSDPTINASKLDEVIAAYVQAVESGQKPDREEWIKRHSDVAAGLRAFFADETHFARIAPPLRDAMAAANTLDSLNATPKSFDPHTVRYFGDYELMDEVARGGMGVVYKARQVSLNRVVALKMVLSGKFAGAEEVQRFKVEAEAAASLDHPNIVPIYEIGEHDGKQYFSMKLVDGGSLCERMSKFGEDRRAAATLLSTVARAVHYAHQRGILHRDLKPANILMDKSERPHVTDFGLAKRVEGESELTQSGAVVGTPAYMPPEQACGQSKHLTTAADVYSLGAIFYEMLTGRPPFEAETALGVLMKVRNDDPQRPSQVKAGIDRDLETICLKCLEKEPQKRYGSAALLADDLNRWLNGEPITARPSSTVDHISKWVKRRPVVAALLMVLVLVSLVGAAGIAWQWRKAEEKSIALSDTLGLLTTSMKEVENKEKLANVARLQAERNEVLARTAQADADKRRDELRRTLYASEMNLAHSAFKAGDVERMKLILERQKAHTDLHGFEWDYLNGLIAAAHRTLPQHFLNKQAVSADGKYIASGAGNKDNLRLTVVKIWELATGRLAHSFDLEIEGESPDAGMCGIGFSPDGKTLQVVAQLRAKETSVAQKVWGVLGIGASSKAALNKFAQLFEFHNVNLERNPRINKQPFDAAGLLCAIQTRSTIEMDLKEGKFWGQFMCLSPDRKTLAIGGTSVASGRATTFDAVALLDLAGGNQKLLLEKHAGRTAAMIFAPDGKSLVWSDFERSVKSWQAAQESPRQILTTEKTIAQLAYAADGKTLAIGHPDGSISIRDAQNGRERSTLKGHLGTIGFLAFLPDNKSLIAIDTEGVGKVWNSEAIQGVVQLRGHEQAVQALALSPDHKKLVSADANGIIKTWDVATGESLSEMSIRKRSKHWFAGFAVSPDTRTAAWCTPLGVDLWDVEKAKWIRTFAGMSVIDSIAFSPDGKTLCTLGRTSNESQTKEVRLHDVDTGQLRFPAFQFIGSYQTAVAFSPDSRTLAIQTQTELGWRDGWKVALVDLETGEKRDTPIIRKYGWPVALVFSPDSKRLATASGNRSVRSGTNSAFWAAQRDALVPPSLAVWDVQTGAELMAVAHLNCDLQGLSFSPDGKRIAVTSASVSVGPQIHLISAISGEELLLLETGGDLARGVMFTPDGKRLIAASNTQSFNLLSKLDSKVTIWGRRGSRDERDKNGWDGTIVDQDGKVLNLANTLPDFKQTAPELKPLDFRVGRWTGESTIKPNPGLPAGGTLRSTATGEWVGDGRHFKQMWEIEGGPAELLKLSGTVIWSYDARKDVYLYHNFDSNGTSNTGTSTWDEKTHTLTWIKEDAKDNTTTTTTAAFPQEGIEIWHIVIKDGGGQVVFDCAGKNTRLKE